MWYDSDIVSAEQNYFLCRGITVAITKNGLTRLELKKEQLTVFPFNLTLKSPAVRQRMSNSSDERRMSGFNINWFLEDSNGTCLTEKLPPRAEDWKPDEPIPKHREPSLADMVQLARRLRMQNMTSEEMKKKVTREKTQNISSLLDDDVCSLGQIKSDKLYSTFPKLVSYIDEEEMEGPATAKDVKISLVNVLYVKVLLVAPWSLPR